MHGNAGNKMEGLEYAATLAPLGIDLVTFDFSGCGRSEGEWVTLGWKEKDDLHAVLQYLKDQNKTSKVLLWGRSMGASTALFYSKEAPVPVCGIVSDSAFADFKGVAMNLVGKMGLPAEMVEMVWPQIVKAVNEATNGMNLKNHNPVAVCPNRHLPIVFVHGVDDELIPMEHTERLFEAYAGEDKDAIYTEGGHNDPRPADTLNQIMAFVKKVCL